MKLLYVGRFSKPKNNLALLKIVNEIILLGMEFTLDFFGDAETVDLNGMIIKNEFLKTADLYSPRINYHGFQHSSIIFQKEYDFLLLPSFWEGFPVVMLEAARSGIIPICSDIQTGPREFILNINSYETKLIYPIIGAGGILMKCPINSNDYQDWADVIKSVFLDKIQLQNLKNEVLKQSKKYSFEEYKSQWENYLDKFI